MKFGTLALVQPQLRHLAATATLVLSVTAGFVMTAGQAQAANDVSLGLSLQDPNSNGEINRIVLSIDNDAADTWVVNGTPGFTVTQGGSGITVSSVAISGSATADPVVVHITLDEADADLDVDTDSVNSNAMEVVYVQAGGGAACTNCLRDGGAELTAFATGDSGAPNTEVDAAAPLIVSQTPASAASGVTKYTSVVITFSEPINTSTDAIASSPVVTLNSTWSNSDKTVTLAPSPSWANSTTYTITASTAADVAASPNAFGGAISGSTVHPWSFSTASTTGYTPPTVVPSSIDLSSPEAGDDYVTGNVMNIRWEYGGSAVIGVVNLYYSVDGGMTFTQIVKGATNDGSYDWTVPDISTIMGHIKIEGTDGVEVMASDLSDAFSVNAGQVGDDEEDEDGEDVEDTDEDAEEEAIENGEVTGVSPVTGQMEVITDVDPGDYIRGSSFDTVYWVDSDMVRHPFYDSQTYFTYQSSFSGIVEVSDATLSTLTLGSPMVPKAGVVLVKIRSVAKVYALAKNSQGETELRWVASETVATEMYGSNWASYVIDIDVTLFDEFAMGDDIDEAMEVDTSIMKTRVKLNSY